MRSDVTHLAKCGKESLYYCRHSGKSICPKVWPNCIWTPKTLTKPSQNNKIHPIAIELSELFATALIENLLNTAWCIELAQTALSYELIAKAEKKPELFVQLKIREKIERDKGVRIV